MNKERNKKILNKSKIYEKKLMNKKNIMEKIY